MRDIVLTVLFLAIAHSEAQVSTLTYMFPVDRDITICPAIISSPSRPSFMLEPSSSTRNVPFLLGTYNVSDTTIMEAVIEPKNSTCTNSSAMCSQLSLRYSGVELRGTGLFIITYTASNGVMRTIRVKFGYAGLYLQNETGGMIVGRVPNTIVANNSLVIFGAVSRVPVACLENGTISNDLFLAPRSFAADECFGNNQSNSQPGLFTVFFANENRTGQERIYFVDNTDCSDGRISDTFLFIFDPPSIDPDSTPTDPITNVMPTPSPPTATQLEAIGIGVGVGGAIAIFIGVLLLVFFLAWYRKRKRRKVKYSDEKGSTVSGTRSKLSSVSTIDGGESSPTLLINPRNGHVPQPMPAPIRKNLYVVKYTNSAAMIAIEDTLAELNEDRYKHEATQENGFLPTYMTKIIADGHRVIIIHGSKPKESVSQSDDIATRWIKELESSPTFTNMRLDNVFVIYLGRNQPPPVVQQIPRLQRIPISQHPDDENSNLDPSSIAKKIQDEIVKLSPVNRLQPVAANVLVPPPPGSSTGSRTPAGSADPSPLVTRNPGAEHPSASSAEHSQSSLTTEGNPENRTGQAVTSNTIAMMSVTKKFLEKENTGSNTTASTPTAARSQGGRDALESSSAPSMIQFEHVIKVVTKVVEAQGKKTVQELKKEVEGVKEKVEEVKDKVEEKGEEVKDKVEEKGEEIKDKVEEKGEEVKDKVEEEGNILSENIEVVLDAVEQTQTELQNRNIEVIQPHGDNNEGGRVTGDVGGASTR